MLLFSQVEIRNSSILLIEFFSHEDTIIPKKIFFHVLHARSDTADFVNYR